MVFLEVLLLALLLGILVRSSGIFCCRSRWRLLVNDKGSGCRMPACWSNSDSPARFGSAGGTSCPSQSVDATATGCIRPKLVNRKRSENFEINVEVVAYVVVVVTSCRDFVFLTLLYRQEGLTNNTTETETEVNQMKWSQDVPSPFSADTVSTYNCCDSELHSGFKQCTLNRRTAFC